MAPTLLVVSLIVIANLKFTSQENIYTARKSNSLENFNEMIDQLIAETEGSTTAPDKEIPILEINDKRGGREEEPTIANPNRLESTTESRNALVSSTNRESPNINDVNSKSKLNDSRIIYINNLIPHNMTFNPVKEGGLNGEKMSHSTKNSLANKIGENEVLQDVNSKPNEVADGDVNMNTEVPQFINPSIIDDGNRIPWFNPRESFEKFERSDGLPTILSSRRSFDGGNPTIEKQKDHGLGVIVKEEIVFEIEDEKVTESSNPPIKVIFHTTTPKSPVTLSKPVKDKYMNTTYLKYPALRTQSILGDKLNKSMYMDFIKTHNNHTVNRSNHQKPPTSIRAPQFPTRSRNPLKLLRPPQNPRNPDNNLKIQAEFMKLNEKINTLQEFLNKTFDQENKTKARNSQIPDEDVTYNWRSKVALRTGYPDMNRPTRPVQGSSINRFVNNDYAPQIYTQPRGPINVLPQGIARPLLLQDPLTEQRMRRRLLVLQLADIAKLTRDMHLMNRLRQNSKYIVPKIVPVYRRRVVLRPLRRTCGNCKRF